jgi:RHS repeat-associated protein
MSFELNENFQPIRRYIYENGKDDVQGHVEYSEVDDPQYFSFERKGWYSYIKDQVGTITKVYKHETKQMINTRTYDTFGNIVNQTGSTSGNLGFQSKYYDQESGLNYYYHRYYNPSIGRFINEDPIGLSGGLNLYGFLNNNSITWIDPYGLLEKDKFYWNKFDKSGEYNPFGNSTGDRINEYYNQINTEIYNMINTYSNFVNSIPFVETLYKSGEYLCELLDCLNRDSELAVAFRNQFIGYMSVKIFSYYFAPTLIFEGIIESFSKQSYFTLYEQIKISIRRCLQK